MTEGAMRRLNQVDYTVLEGFAPLDLLENLRWRAEEFFGMGTTSQGGFLK